MPPNLAFGGSAHVADCVYPGPVCRTAIGRSPGSGARAAHQPNPRDQQDGYKDPPQTPPGTGAPCGISEAAAQPHNTLTAGRPNHGDVERDGQPPRLLRRRFLRGEQPELRILGVKSHMNPPTPASPSKAKPRMWSLAVTLPSARPARSARSGCGAVLSNDVTADKCPPASIPTGSTYYSCSNVALTAASTGAGGTGGPGTGGSGGGSARGGAGGTTGVAGSPGQGGSVGGSVGGPAGQTGATAGAAGTAVDPTSSGQPLHRNRGQHLDRRRGQHLHRSRRQHLDRSRRQLFDRRRRQNRRERRRGWRVRDRHRYLAPGDPSDGQLADGRLAQSPTESAISILTFQVFDNQSSSSASRPSSAPSPAASSTVPKIRSRAS